MIGQGCGVLEHGAIEKRRARLERIGHRHPIGLHQQIVMQVAVKVGRQQLIERRGAVDAAKALEVTAPVDAGPSAADEPHQLRSDRR